MSTAMERNGRPSKLSSVQRAEACRLYRSGWSVRRLARRYGMGFSTVSKVLRKAGVEMRPRGPRDIAYVDPIWGRLAYLMYRPREFVGFSGNENSGRSRSTTRIDLGSPPE